MTTATNKIEKTTVKLHLTKARNRLEVMPYRDNYKIDLAMLEVLGEMALLNIVPDGTFSDVECNAWEVFCRIIEKAKKV